MTTQNGKCFTLIFTLLPQRVTLLNYSFYMLPIMFLIIFNFINGPFII